MSKWGPCSEKKFKEKYDHCYVNASARKKQVHCSFKSFWNGCMDAYSLGSHGGRFTNGEIGMALKNYMEMKVNLVDNNSNAPFLYKLQYKGHARHAVWKSLCQRSQL